MFTGFEKDGPSFLSELEAHNNKEWFQANKARFQASLATPAKEFVQAVERELGGEWRGKVFRIYRDLRFSKDKTPYNTHLRIGFFQEGEAGLFFSLEPESLILGAGSFDFGKEGLDRYREAVASETGVELQKLLETHKKQGFRLDEAELKRVPRGFEPEHPRAALLRRKSLALWKDDKVPSWLFSKTAVPKTLELFERLQDLRTWLRGVL